MRWTLAMLMAATMLGTAVAGPIYTNQREYKSPEIRAQEMQEWRRDMGERTLRCLDHPYHLDCYRPPSTSEKILRELELMRKAQ